MRHAPPIRLTRRDRAALLRLSEASIGSGHTGIRARIVLESAGGRTNSEIARLLGVHPETVTRWRRRYSIDGLIGLDRGAPKVGGPATLRPELIERILSTALDAHPGRGSGWSTRSLARAVGTNHMLVHRVWTAHGVAATASRAPASPVTALPRVDVEGFYLHPPAGVVVFRVEPAPRGTSGSSPRLAPTAFDPKRLVVALSRVEGELGSHEVTDWGRLELLVFLRGIEEHGSPDAQHNVVFDRPLESLPSGVTAWLERHPRYRAFSTPTGERWSSVVDRWLHRWEPVSVHSDSFRGIPALVRWMSDLQGRPGAPDSPPAWTLRARVARSEPVVSGGGGA